MEVDILFLEIALFKEIYHKPNAKISKNKKRCQLKKVKLRLLKMEGAGMIGVLSSFLPPPPLIFNEDDAKSFNPNRTSLLADDIGIAFGKDAYLPAHTFQDTDHRMKMNRLATSSNFGQGQYNPRPRVGGLK